MSRLVTTIFFWILYVQAVAAQSPDATGIASSAGQSAQNVLSGRAVTIKSANRVSAIAPLVGYGVTGVRIDWIPPR